MPKDSYWYNQFFLEKWGLGGGEVEAVDDKMMIHCNHLSLFSLFYVIQEELVGSSIYSFIHVGDHKPFVNCLVPAASGK